jgi:uncharacterized membrane protein/nitrite reductase/ring-hydroxylating ferredoxin subunit
MLFLILTQMKSTAHFKSHPIHPILVAFPIAFFTGTLIFDILGLIFSNEAFHVTAYYLELSGIIGGLLAAVPGLIDYFFTVPPKSTAKKRATMHMIVNVTAVALFTIAFMLRVKSHIAPATVLSLEFLGMILMTAGGWMGGTLVYRNQIGVDVRYANAGKWNKEVISKISDRILVADSGELKINQMKLIVAGERRIVIARSENGFVAFDDRCTHRGGSLASGSMICGTVQCPWHGSQFDVTTGALKAGPAKQGIASYTVLEDSGKVYLAL